MIPNTANILVEIAAILLTFFIAFRCVGLIKTGKKPVTAALFLFAVVSFMMSLAYWLTYSLIRPDVRMPFAANEIGEIAFFLLLASTLNTVFHENMVSARKELVFTILFIISSVALWIGWSGEWIQDIIYGFAFGYYLCTCIRALKQTDALNNSEWRILGSFCGSIILAQTISFFAPEAYKQAMDLFCYALMFAALIWLLVKTIFMSGKEGDEGAAFAMSFSVHALNLSNLYMSAGWFYLATFILSLLTLLLMLRVLDKEVRA